MAAGRETKALRPKVSFIPTIELDRSQENQKDILKNFVRELCRVHKVRVQMLKKNMLAVVFANSTNYFLIGMFQGQHPQNCVEIL